MPSVIEAPETAEEAQEQLSHDAVEITLTLRPGFVSKITALLWGVAPSLRELYVFFFYSFWYFYNVWHGILPFGYLCLILGMGYFLT